MESCVPVRCERPGAGRRREPCAERLGGGGGPDQPVSVPQRPLRGILPPAAAGQLHLQGERAPSCGQLRELTVKPHRNGGGSKNVLTIKSCSP